VQGKGGKNRRRKQVGGESKKKVLDDGPISSPQTMKKEIMEKKFKEKGGDGA